jgi:hypothetical protein
MISGKDNCVLTTNLDCAGYGIRRCGAFDAANLLHVNDPRLTDSRTMIIGSVTDESVYGAPIQPPDEPVPPDQRIVQSKLNLNGTMPLSFVNNSFFPSAARGDLYQPLSEKGAANGYASLDGTGHIPSGQITMTGTGTLKDLQVTTPSLFTLSAILSSGSISMSGGWSAAPGLSWFGTPPSLDATVPPGYFQGPVSPSLVPSLAASKVISGTLNNQRLPVALGLGAGHSIGAVPDTGTAGNPTDYLGRDMQWKPMTPSLAYQPTLNAPVISVISFDAIEPDAVNVNISTADHDICFYHLSSSPSPLFVQFTGPVSVPSGQTIEAYAVKTGYNASPTTYFTN